VLDEDLLLALAAALLPPPCARDRLAWLSLGTLVWFNARSGGFPISMSGDHKAPLARLHNLDGQPLFLHAPSLSSMAPFRDRER
jgi:hypothetical protein